MSAQDTSVGPVQLVILGFETTEHFHGQVARELVDLRGRGMIRVLDARLYHRAPDGALTEVDLGPLIADWPDDRANALSRLLGANGGGGNGGMRSPEALVGTVGFAVDDLRRLTDEIGPGQHAVAILVEHVWAARLREAVRETGARLVAQGYLTPELVMLAGAEIQARADAEAAIELASAARGAALVEALSVLAQREPRSAEERVSSAAEVVSVLTARGFVHESEAPAAIDALATAGLIEMATVEAAVAEAERMLSEVGGGERSTADPD
jgi:hypothetical protein